MQWILPPLRGGVVRRANENVGGGRVEKLPEAVAEEVINRVREGKGGRAMQSKRECEVSGWRAWAQRSSACSAGGGRRDANGAGEVGASSALGLSNLPFPSAMV